MTCRRASLVALTAFYSTTTCPIPAQQAQADWVSLKKNRNNNTQTVTLDLRVVLFVYCERHFLYTLVAREDVICAVVVVRGHAQLAHRQVVVRLQSM